MLRDRLMIGAAAAALLCPLIAMADGIEVDEFGGDVTVSASGTIASNASATSTPKAPARKPNGGERVCMSGETEVPCSSSFGTWIDGKGMWCTKASPQPPPEDPAWDGNTGGAIYTCVRPQGTNVADSGMAFQQWLPDGADAPAPPPNPEDLAWEAIATINLQPITLGTTPTPLEHNPNALGAVHMPIWLWADNPTKHQIGPIAATATERGYTVAIEATATSITFNLGDGTNPITCTTWKQPPPQARPDTPVICGSQTGYTTQGEHTITATTNWTVNWQGIGQTGTIHHTSQTTATVRIGELHTLNSTAGR